MAIQEIVKNKKYLVRVYYRDSFGKSKGLKKTVNGTITKAKLAEAELISKINSNSNDNITFEKLFELYLESKTNVSKDTIRKYRERYKKSFISLRNKKVSNIKPIDYLIIRNEIEATDSTWTQKNQAVYLLKSITKFGYEYLNIVDNARMLKSIPKERSTKPKFNTITIEEFNEIMTFEKNYVYYALFTLIYWAGLRKSEARLIRKIDVKNGGVDISDEHRDLKNRSSSRFIPLDKQTYSIISKLLQTDGEWLFGDSKPIPDTNINRHLKNCINAANGVRERSNLKPIPHTRVHDLRHSHATLLIENGENIKVVSERLGHSSTSETQKTYIHLYKDADKRVAQNLDNIRNGFNKD